MNKNGAWEFFRKNQNITALCACGAAVALNLLLGLGASALGLPLYLDTVGTVMIAVLGGYLPGVSVGFATNIVKNFFDNSSLYYGVLNVLIAVMASYLARRGHFRRIRDIPLAVFLFMCIGGGLGALIPWFMESLSFDSESLSGVLYRTGFFGPFSSHLFSSLIMDLPDKLATVLLVMPIVNSVPEKLLPYFRFNIWMQNPVAGVKDELNRKSGSRVLSLRKKLMLVLGFSLVTVALAGTYISVMVYRRTNIGEHRNLAMGMVGLAAKVIDGDRVDAFLADGESAEGYTQTKALLSDILHSSREIAYLYVYKMEQDGWRVIIDIATEKTPADDIGALIPYEKGLVPYIPRLLAGEEVEPIITRDSFGYLLTAMKPVYDSSGRCVCYAIADIDMEALLANEKSFLVELETVFLSFFILLCVFVIWLSDCHVVFPVRALTMYVDAFSRSHDSQEKLDEYVKAFRKLDVHTGDEIEQLFKSLCQMVQMQAEQTRSIRQLSESTAKMQDGLIITMANIVENRDSDTGLHIRKTTAYVKIIVEGLKKKGYYPEKITPKFMSDVVRSAPLHDVGKIYVPDGVLNKPGRLTDEEYELMKTHTTAGKKIIEDAIAFMEGESYLKEARNMAAYHHERWDGTGYPEQLHGEVIPLSARIMALADEFDALTSPRVYKAAFPLEKALAIIEEGKGKVFDPKCVEVFMESLPNVKVILRKYNHEI